MERRLLVGAMTGPGRGGLGVLGGTFDPVHVGHLAVAAYARDALGLEGVLFIPAGIPPHKTDRPLTAAHHRLAMVELAVAGHPSFEASRLEVDRPGPSYAVDTMTILADAERASGHARGLYFILSSEAAAGLPGWRDPDRLLSLCRLAVVPRGGTTMPRPGWIEEHFPGRADRFVALDGPDVPVSASHVRRIAAAGGPLGGLVPPAVERYIIDHGLYTRDVWRKN
jgi:nicotinate-nucleotide adenylyltransferase